MNSYKELIVWQKSVELVVEIYRITKIFPTEEKFSLVNQMRRASVSIPSNIAEGYARRGNKENAQFINIAFGSAIEIETQIIISKKLNFVKIDEWARIDGLLNEVLRMLFRYRQSLLSSIG